MGSLFTGSIVARKEISRDVAVLGGGVSGLSAKRLAVAQGRGVRLFDEKGGERGDPTFEPQPNEYAFGIVSPGFPRRHPWRAAAEDAGLRLIGESAYADSLWKGPVLSVTGTNGKTTLTRFLKEALERNGEQAHTCGNIGRPFSDLCAEVSAPDQWAVCEASSFQLFDWPKIRCEAGFWTNFDHDHLDWHPDLGDYFSAKWRLVASGVPVFAGRSVRRWALEFGYQIPQNLMVVEEVHPRLSGRIGVFDKHPWSKLFGLVHRWWMMTGRDEQVLMDAAREFVLSPHRLETVARFGGVTFVNDSKATNPHATLAVVEAVDGPVHWLGGGSWKGEDLFSFARKLKGRIESAHLFGRTGEEFAEILAREGSDAGYHTGLEEAFRSAVGRAGPGSTVLLSPGFASFDQFGSYAERGEAFRALVNGLRGGG